MKKTLIFILTIITIILLVYFTKPINIKPIDDSTNKCLKDMQKYENIICD